MAWLQRFRGRPEHATSLTVRAQSLALEGVTPAEYKLQSPSTKWFVPTTIVGIFRGMSMFFLPLRRIRSQAILQHEEQIFCKLRCVCASLFCASVENPNYCIPLRAPYKPRKSACNFASFYFPCSNCSIVIQKPALGIKFSEHCLVLILAFSRLSREFHARLSLDVFIANTTKSDVQRQSVSRITRADCLKQKQRPDSLTRDANVMPKNFLLLDLLSGGSMADDGHVRNPL